MLTIPLEDLLAFPKLGTSMHLVSERLFTHHMPTLLQIPSVQFLQLLSGLESAICSVELPMTTVAQAASSMGSLCLFYYTQKLKGTQLSNSYVQRIEQHLSGDRGILVRSLQAIFRIVLFEDVRSTGQHPYCKAMLPMIFVTDGLSALSEPMMAQLQAPDRRVCSFSLFPPLPFPVFFFSFSIVCLMVPLTIVHLLLIITPTGSSTRLF